MSQHWVHRSCWPVQWNQITKDYISYLALVMTKTWNQISKVFPQKSEYYFVESNVGRARQRDIVKDMICKKVVKRGCM